MTTSAELQARRVAAVPRGIGNVTQIFAKRALNSEIWSEDGKRYIDFGAGIAVVNTGHQHPRLIKAIEEQLKAFSHVCFQVTPYENYITLAERLNAIAPVPGPAKTMLASTGAEAVENAVKVARAFTKRPGIISFTGGFHGRTPTRCEAEKRVDAMMQAVQALRAPLDTFYNSLTEEQKRRLDSLANRGGHNKAGETITQLCSDSAARFTNLPSEQIQQTVQPKEQQMPAFEALKAASSKAANILNGTCPSETPSTPGDRLDAMAKRLNATAQALNTVRPALQDFYASLDDEQKARFNTMNKQAQR